MEMNSVKERVKDFYEEHKVACKVAGAAGLIAVGSVIGWKCCCKVYKHDIIAGLVLSNKGKAVLNDAFNTYNGKTISGLEIWNPEPMKLEDMGILADIAREGNCNMTQKLTHIVAIGLPLEE